MVVVPLDTGPWFRMVVVADLLVEVLVQEPSWRVSRPGWRV